MSNARLSRSENDKMLGGVCGGIASYLGVDSVLVRLAFVVLLFASGIGLPIYVILWAIMPLEADVAKPGSEVFQQNLGEMSGKVTSGMGRVGRPGTIGIIMILLGAYFLLDQVGWLHWARGAFWPLLIIVAGVYLLVQRRQ